MGSRPRVVVVGPAAWNHLIVVDTLPQPRSQMLLANDSWWTVGGTSAGKALHLLDCGADVTLVTPVGRDAAGETILSELERAGLDVVPVDAQHTESHTNVMTPAGERLSLYTALPGAPTARAVGTAVAAMAGADALVVDLSAIGRAVLDAAVAAATPLWTDLHDWDGHQAFHAPFAAAGTTVALNDDGAADASTLAALVRDNRARLVVRTLGARGAEALDRHGAWHRVRALPATVVDSNGAGDAFAAGALMAELAGSSPSAVLEAGSRQALRALGTRHLSPLLD